MKLITLVVSSALVIGAGCAKPGGEASSTDIPPLPPLSRTQVGLLVHHEAELELTLEQVTRLKEIDRTLLAEIEPLQREVEDLEAPPSPPPAERGGEGGGGGPGGGGGMGGPPGGGGMGGGGMGGGGMGGPPPGGGGGGGGGRGGGGPPPGKRPPGGGMPMKDRSEHAARLRDQIADKESAALAAALDLLRPEQRARAEAILADR